MDATDRHIHKKTPIEKIQEGLDLQVALRKKRKIPKPPAHKVFSGLTTYEQKILRRAAARMARRRFDALTLYEPLPIAEGFHESTAPERIVRGSNRAGKTLSAAAEIARAVRGLDPYNKYPKTDGRAFIVGKDLTHIGQVIYKKLFQAGSFKMIPAKDSPLFEAHRPWTVDHCNRANQIKPAPPLIPQREIEETGWENKKENIPSVITMKNGWELAFFSSLGKPPQGTDLDLVWFDEEIVDPAWYVEMSARLLDRSGRFIWSATPQAGSEHLWDLHEMAEEQRSQRRPRVQEYMMTLAANPHISDREKEEFAAKLTNDADIQVRIHGEFAIRTFRIYPEFDMGIHGCEPFAIPSYWTLYMAVDPGRQVCGVLFLAVPPEGSEKGDHFYIFDELYIKSCTADEFGQQASRVGRGGGYYTFLIDSREGRKAQTGSGVTIETEYAEALKRYDFSSETTGNGFMWAPDDVNGGIEAVRELLRIRGDGKPKLQIFKGKCPNLEYEFERYKWARQKEVVLDKPAQRNDHLMDCLRYLAIHDPQFHEVTRKKKRENWALKQIRMKKERANRNRGMYAEGISLG